LQLGEQRVNRTERTRNISSSGVCFVSPTAVDVGARIEYIITLSGNKAPVHLHCLGKVLRSSQPSASNTGEFEVAVTIERYQFERAAEAARA
jgi:PilZ domain